LAVFFWAALSKHVYNRTLPYRVLAGIFGDENEHSWETALRKLYSIGAFSIAGFVVDAALGPSRHRMLRAALVIAAFSACIEIGQALHHSHEPLAEHLFDVGCGAAGGCIGAWLGQIARRRA
jgi:hypothetical protein